MKRPAGRLLPLFLLLAGPLWAQSELWERAAALSGLGDGYLPGTMTSVMEELDGNGARKSIAETTTRMTYDADGKVQKSEIVRAFRDGKDVTEEMKRDAGKTGKRAGSGGGTAFAGWGGMLWSDDSRKKTRLLPGATWAIREGRRSAVIPFEMEVSGLGRMQGTAEIDAESGVPSIVRTTASFLVIRDLTFAMEYAPVPSGGFVLSRMEFAGTFALLLKRTKFRGSLELLDYVEAGSATAAPAERP
jgi:hypothetical protein